MTRCQGGPIHLSLDTLSACVDRVGDSRRALGACYSVAILLGTSGTEWARDHIPSRVIERLNECLRPCAGIGGCSNEFLVTARCSPVPSDVDAGSGRFSLFRVHLLPLK